MKRRGLLFLWTCTATLLAVLAQGQSVDDWQSVEQNAAGQTVYFNAWGGDPAINRYIAWAAGQLHERGITLVHVKVTDIAEAVSRIRAEYVAGRRDDGSIDLLWINGENFAALKSTNLLYGPWADQVPGARFINWDNPTTRTDGSLATQGYELPWGTSALTFFYDTTRVARAPSDPAELLAWIEAHPGRFTYPQPPAFVGSAFLKQIMLLVAADPMRLDEPVGGDFDSVTEPLWRWLDRAHASMWRRGRLFANSGPALRDLLAVGEVDWMMSYNPSEAQRAIGQGELHATIGAMHFAGGAVSNSHFLAIPANSGVKDAAQVVANFLVSARAQSRKADAAHWGDATVLRIEALPESQQALFSVRSTGNAMPPPARRFLSEPHPSWTTALEQAWLARYSR